MQEKTVIMKELPESERPYEKCRMGGPGILSDAELLAVILRSGTRGINSLELSMELLRHFSDLGGLAALSRVSAEELTDIPGIGPVKALQLLCVGELSRRMVRTRVRREVILDSPKAIARYFMEDMRHLENEEVVAAFFDTRGGLIGSRIISMGTVNVSVVTPREIFIEALRLRAVTAVILHNHPSGDPSPSAEDILLTRRIFESGQLLGIPLWDHIVIGDQCYVSFKESDLLPVFQDMPEQPLPFQTDLRVEEEA